MTVTTLGTWRNPPLAYVVAELVISPHYTLGSRIPDLQDRLRSRFPRTIEAPELVVGSAVPDMQPVWLLMTGDQSRCVRLSTRSISLHCTSYVDSDDFLQRWAEVLDAIEGAKVDAFVERAGLRYIDLIVPNDGRMPDEYLVEGIRGVTPVGGSVRGAIWAAEFDFEGSTVHLRTGAPSPPGMLLPPNFVPLQLTMPPVMQAANDRVNSQRPVGFVDTDCLRAITQTFAARDLMETYRGMHRLVSKVFRTALSNLAQEEWV